MAAPFFERLREYYLRVAKVLSGEAEASSIFPNPSDVGDSRERIYIEFLRQHAPQCCGIFKGGFLFDSNGQESSQLDVIVTADSTPRFDLRNKDGAGKSFAHVEGTLAVVSVKSTLDKQQLFDSLLGMASIPPTPPLGKRINPVAIIPHYEDWPLKVIYASNGIGLKTILSHINAFYEDNPQIPLAQSA